MKSWLHLLLVVTVLINGSAFSRSDHNEALEQLEFRIDRASSIIASHCEHRGCNHSCHASAHATGIVRVALSFGRVPTPDTPPGYMSESIPLDPSTPPTHPPDVV